MTREEAIIILDCERPYGNCGCGASIEEIEDALNMAIKALKQEPVLDKIRAEIEQEIEQENFARSVFRYEEKDAVKAEQCTGSIIAYHKVIKFIDIFKVETEKA